MNSLLQFKFPADLTMAQFLTQLSSQIDLQSVSSQQYLITYYDSFDWRLYSHRMIGELVQSKNKSVFTVKTAKNGSIITSTELRKMPRFSQQFKQENVRKMLAPILEMRALLPVCSMVYQCHHLNIVNEHKKITLRLVIEEHEQLRHRVSLQTLKGYETAAKTVIDILTTQLHLIPATPKPNLRMALKLQGRKVNDYSSKLTIQLQPEMRADVASKLIYSQLLKTIKDNEHGTITDIDSEFLHDFRVAVRRTRAALSQLKKVLPDDINARYKAFFSWLGSITSATRDLDVYLLNFTDYKNSLPVESRDHLNPLHDYLLKKQRHAQRQLAKHLRSADYLSTLSAWEQYLKEPTLPYCEQAIKIQANKWLRKSFKRVLREGNAITDQSPAEALHELRKSCKKLRYLMEFFQSLYAKNKIKTLIKALKELQDVLGEFQDCEVQEHNLQLFSTEMRTLDTPAETFLAIDKLIDNLETHRQEIRSQFAIKFTEFKQEETLRTFKLLFG